MSYVFLWELFGNCLGIVWEFGGNCLGISWEFEKVKREFGGNLKGNLMGI
jgi:hypothetical protein